MPCTIRQLTPSGLQPVAYTADSLADAARHEPDDGIYTIANTFNTTQVLKLDAHLDRLEDSARRADIPLRYERASLRAALREVITTANYGSVRYRLTVPRDRPDHIIISVEPFAGHPPELYRDGVRCATVPAGKRINPDAKTTGWMHDRETLRAAMPPGTYEGLLLDDAGAILEGLSTNFYAILDGELRTAGSGVLAGIAQQIIFEVAPRQLPVQREPVCLADLPRLSEAFISSSSRGIVPVVQIDDQIIDTGTPGPQTRTLSAAYDEWVAQHLEAL